MTTPDPLDDLDLARTIRPDGPVVLAGRYRVVRELGRGGMGTVYLAEDQRLDNRKVALKMPPPILARNARAVQTLKREALLAMQLSHPHIVTLRAFEQCDDGVFLVMDFIDGQTLEQLLAQRTQIPEDEVVRIFTPIAQALDYAHSKKVIHRDVKPANILLAADGTPFITDFGVAGEIKDTCTRITGRSDTSGTLPYMSPEQLRGQAPAPAQDIYSLAAAIYECLAGNAPFHRGQIEYQIVNEQPSPLPSGVPHRIARLMDALAKSPEARPPACLALFDPGPRIAPPPPVVIAAPLRAPPPLAPPPPAPPPFTRSAAPLPLKSQPLIPQPSTPPTATPASAPGIWLQPLLLSALSLFAGMALGMVEPRLTWISLSYSLILLFLSIWTQLKYRNFLCSATFVFLFYGGFGVSSWMQQPDIENWQGLLCGYLGLSGIGVAPVGIVLLVQILRGRKALVQTTGKPMTPPNKWDWPLHFASLALLAGLASGALALQVPSGTIYLIALPGALIFMLLSLYTQLKYRNFLCSSMLVFLVVVGSCCVPWIARPPSPEERLGVLGRLLLIGVVGALPAAITALVQLLRRPKPPPGP